jgi:hypothetical protein
MKKMGLIFIIFTFLGIVSAQENVRYDVEEGVDQVEAKHSEAWVKVKKVEGYRIQLIAMSGNNSKAIVEKMQTDFMTAFPGVPAYVTYFEPSFRLRVGDFRTKLEAYYLKSIIEAQFPGGFIIKDKVEYLPKN